MTIRIFLYLILPLFITGYIASKAANAQGNTESKAILAAQFKSAEGRDAIKTYLDKFFLYNAQSGTFSKDPFSNRYKWVASANTAEAKTKVPDNSSLVLLLRDTTLVWEEEFKKYLQSPIGKGRLLRKQNNYSEALKYFIEHSYTNPEDYYVFQQLGWTYFHLDQYENSAKSFQKSSTLTTENKWNYFGLASALYWTGDLDKAMIFAKKSLEISKEKKSNNEKIKYLMAMIHLAKGNYEEAYNIVGKKSLIGVHVDKKKDGFLINRIYKGSPADSLGLKPGDIITELNSQPTSTIENLSTFYKFDYGKILPIKILRDEVSYKGDIAIGINPRMNNAFNYKPALIKQENDNHLKQNTISKSPNAIENETLLVSNNQSIPQKNNAFADISNQWAIIIGISKYKYSSSNGLTNLIFADDDAKLFSRSLLNLGWSESHIKLLTNEEATQRSIMIALKSWLTKAGPDDQVILFWAGHGYADPENPEKVYLATYDTDISIPATGYRMDEVRKALEEIRAKNVVLFADTCHAGKLITRGTGNRSISIVPNIKKQHVPKGWIFMVGADTDRQAIEHSSWSNGAFTHSLVKGLNGEADGFQSAGAKDGVVTMGELKDYMKTSMPDETQKILGVAKHPVITTSSGDPDIWNLTLKVTQ